jgi:hypothetical protein
MTSVITHIGIGIIFAEILLRVLTDKSEYKEKRISFWFFGLLGGLTPDLDIIPALILGKDICYFHHYFTHTILAVILCIIIISYFKFNPLSLVFFIGYILHLFTDFIDNSLTPFSPFFLYIDELGFLSSIEIGLNISDIFMVNGWGWHTTFMFISYYDLIGILISITLITYLIYLYTKKKYKWLYVIEY